MARHVIPGYREAVEREQLTRAAAFLDGPATYSGIEFSELTLRRLLLLAVSGNPFICGGQVSPGDAGQLLWICSPECTPDPRKRDKFIRRISRIDSGILLAGIREYLDAMLADLPGGSGQMAAQPTHWAAGVVHAIASAYGWTDECIMDLPVRRLWQYLRCIRRQSDPKAVFANPSDRVRAQWLNERNKRNG